MLNNQNMIIRAQPLEIFLLGFFLVSEDGEKEARCLMVGS